jgi:hypothetical protein
VTAEEEERSGGSEWRKKREEEGEREIEKMTCLTVA